MAKQMTPAMASAADLWGKVLGSTLKNELTRSFNARGLRTRQSLVGTAEFLPSKKNIFAIKSIFRLFIVNIFNFNDLMDEITPGDVGVRLGRNLKSRRVSQGLRLVDASQRSGLSVPTIRAIERGDSSVSFGNYAFVAVMLGAGDLFKSIFEDRRDSGSDLERSRVRVSKPKAMR